MEHRAKDRRVQESLSEVRDQQRRLEARIRAEQAQAAELDRRRHDAGVRAAREQLAANGVETVTEETLHAIGLEKLKENIEKRALWPLGDARNLVRQGYSVEGTMARTGWPAEMLADVIPGEW
jgi:sulfite reductase beta subunit-like hemoprotein